MPIFSRSKLRRTTAAAFALMVVSTAMTLFASHGYTREMPLRDPAPNSTNFSALATPTPTPTPTNVVVSGSTGADTGYATLKDAFVKINLQSQTGNNIIVSINLDTAETASAVLNDKGWTSLTITPSGARTISGAFAGPLIDLNGADKVTIDGLNANGNSLTISNSSVSTATGNSTIRFINGATQNKVTNCNILGSVGGGASVSAGTVIFGEDIQTINGNDNNTISNNNIGPASGGLPAKAIWCAGQTNTAAAGNSGNLIDNNNIFDYFHAASSSVGYMASSGCSNTSITNNRFYQSTQKIWSGTQGSQHYAIYVADQSPTYGAQGFTISGNTIGYANSSQTGIYSLSGGGSGAKFIAVYFNAQVAGTGSVISDNTIASVSVTGGIGAGTTSSTPFAGIVILNGGVTVSGNTIGSPSSSGSLTFSTNTSSPPDIFGIYNAGTGSWTASVNVISGISATNTNANANGVTVTGIRGNSG